MCAELACLQPGHDMNLTLADVLATHELKSFDYRVRGGMLWAVSTSAGPWLRTLHRWRVYVSTVVLAGSGLGPAAHVTAKPTA